MKAVVIREHGGPDCVRFEDIPAPTPGPGEALIEVRAAALNHLDIWVRKGRPGMKLQYPHVLGSDLCGEVAALGSGVDEVSVGDEVVLNPGLSSGKGEYCFRGEQSEEPGFGIVGLSRSGTFAEKVVMPAGSLYPKPAHLSDEEAAALPLAYVTAWRMLFTKARMVPGESVLIHGIGGGAALAGLQLAKLAAGEVIVTSSSDEKLERAKALGADHAINYKTTPDVGAAVKEFTRGRGVDIAFDTVGAATWAINFASVRRGGRIVHCGITTGPTAEVNIQALYWNQVSVHGSTMGSHEDFRRMVKAVTNARMKPVVDSVLPLDKGPEAMARMEAGEQFGKIVLKVG